MSLPLLEKVIIVTGASRGIGASIARRLASDGANVVINYVSSSKQADDLAAELTAKGPGRAVAIKADLTSVAEAKRLVDETVQTFGKLDVLALNAAIMENALLSQIDEELYDKHYNTNVKVPLFMTQHAAPLMKEGKLSSHPSPAPLLSHSTRPCKYFQAAVLSFSLRHSPLTLPCHPITCSTSLPREQ